MGKTYVDQLLIQGYPLLSYSSAIIYLDSDLKRKTADLALLQISLNSSACENIMKMEWAPENLPSFITISCSRAEFDFELSFLIPG